MTANREKEQQTMEGYLKRQNVETRQVKRHGKVILVLLMSEGYKLHHYNPSVFAIQDTLIQVINRIH
jgi:hypothetical protein